MAAYRSTFLSLVDKGLRALVFSKFQEDMNLADMDLDSVFTRKGIAMREVAERRGKDASEFFNIWRTDEEMDWKRHNTARARRGFPAFAGPTANGSSVFMLKSQPVTMNYLVTMWSLTKERLNAVVEDYIWWMHQDPKLPLVFLTDQQFELNLTMSFGRVQDEDTVEEQYIKGLYYTATFPISLDSYILHSDIVKQITRGYIKIVDTTLYDGFDARAEVLTDGEEKIMDFYVKDVTDAGVGAETVVKS